MGHPTLLNSTKLNMVWNTQEAQRSWNTVEWAWHPKEQESSGSSASEEEPGLRVQFNVLKRSFPRGEISSSSEVLFYPHRQSLKTSNTIL